MAFCDCTFCQSGNQIQQEFIELARNALSSEAAVPEPYSTACCADRWIGTIDRMCNFTWLRERSAGSGGRPIIDVPKTDRKIYLILESPHKDEFQDGVGAAIGPAMGSTGRNIESYLDKSLAGILDKQAEYHLVLVNAIQYQCSLNRDPRQYRDLIFRQLWAGPARDCFIARMNAYWKQGDIVVNCCTRGSPKTGDELRLLVESAIKTVTHISPTYTRCHPSSYWWTIGKAWQPDLKA